MINEVGNSSFVFGWAQTDITPLGQAVITGQFHTRVSEGMLDPLTATVWAMESGSEQTVLVSCDLIAISNDLYEQVRTLVVDQRPELDPLKIVIHATHTHAGPEIRIGTRHEDHAVGGVSGLNLAFMAVEDYVQFAADRIVQAIIQAWDSRRAGGIAFGIGTAVIGRNRRWIDLDGKATMYGLTSSVGERFRHIEGYEDHSLQLLATYHSDGSLNGLVVNIPCPSQVSSQEYRFSADFWHETRVELRKRYGDNLFVLPQCSAAGELTSHLLYDNEANSRMLALKGRSVREEIAHHIVESIGEILPAISKSVDWHPELRHQVERVSLPLNPLSASDVQAAKREVELREERFRQEKRKLVENPELRGEPHWYRTMTAIYGIMHWNRSVIDRYEEQRVQAERTKQEEVHVIRIGDVLISTLSFECYLDYGIQLKVRSPSVQTFLVQLAGEGTYLPSPRAVQARGYGAVPASNLVGAEGGQKLVEHTTRMMKEVWG